MGLVLRAPFDMEHKVSIWQHMLTLGIQPSRQVLLMMLEWTSINSEAALSELVMQPLKPGLSPSAAEYSRLVKTCAWSFRGSSAQHLLEDAVNKVHLLFLMQALHGAL